VTFILLAARAILAAVFVLAGIAKLRDQTGFRAALGDFGTPRSFRVPLAAAFPLAELAVAAALLVAPVSWFGAAGAAVLLLVFSLAIAVNLLQGNQPDCHCFGQIQAKPAGWYSVARNCLLLLLAAVVLWQGIAQPDFLSAARGVSPAGASIVILSLLAVGFAWLAWQLLHRYGQLLLRLEELEGGTSVPTIDPSNVGLPVGFRAPSFALPDISGRLTTLDSLVAPGKSLALVFADPACDSCAAILPTISALDAPDSPLTVAVISRGQVDANQQKMGGYAFRHLLLQSDREVAGAYRVPATPGVVIIQPEKTVAGPTALGATAIHQLLETLHLPVSVAI